MKFQKSENKIKATLENMEIVEFTFAGNIIDHEASKPAKEKTINWTNRVGWEYAVARRGVDEFQVIIDGSPGSHFNLSEMTGYIYDYIEDINEAAELSAEEKARNKREMALEVLEIMEPGFSPVSPKKEDTTPQLK